MNLQKLFKTQQALEEHINAQHPLQEGEDRLSKKILALQVELGELANEWRGFKFWSEEQEPKKFLSSCKNDEAELYFCGICHEKYHDFSQLKSDDDGDKICSNADCNENYLMSMKMRNPLLEEYADCLHFILSIGLEMELDCRYNSLIRKENIVEEGEPTLHLFAEVFAFASDLFWCCHQEGYEQQEGNYQALFTNFVQLGKSLNFTWDEIEAAYYTKNKINHARQEANY